jgi:hypothetical protein
MGFGLELDEQAIPTKQKMEHVPYDQYAVEHPSKQRSYTETMAIVGWKNNWETMILIGKMEKLMYLPSVTTVQK